MRTNRLFLFAVLAAAALVDAIQVQAPAHAQTTDPVLVGAGDIVNCNKTQDEETAKLLDAISGTVFTLGDNVYLDGTAAQFTGCYGPSWGRHKARTRPSPGNHDYHVSGAAGYFGYFGAAASPLDSNCTSNCKGYYSYNLGTWHIIALNSEIDFSPGSAQDQWLRADLAANKATCTLAYWHEPLFSSGLHGNVGRVRPLWEVLYQYGADVVLSAHDHDYERFAPQNPNGQADPRGIREFVAGTGGAGLYPLSRRQPNSEVQNNATWGVLKLTLHSGSYDWEFVPIAGQTFRDSGRANCTNPGSGGVPSSPSISGNVGAPGAILSFSDGTPRSAVSDRHGDYTFPVSKGWSGTVTPFRPGYWFYPVNRNYSNVLTDQVLQNFTASNHWAGGVTIQANRDVVAVARPHIGAQIASYNGFSSGSLTSYLPMLFKGAFGGTYDSAFYVQNLDATHTSAITIRYYDSTGALTCSQSDTIAPLASRGYWVPALGCLPAGWVGGAVVTSNYPIVTIGRPHIGKQVMTYNGFASGSLTAYLPMLFKNGFGGSYDAAFYIQNVDEALPAGITIRYYDTSGALSCTKTLASLAPLSSQGLWLPDESCLPADWVGSAVISSDYPIVAIARPHIGPEIMVYDGVSVGSLNAYVPMLFKNAFGGSYDAAFYIQNVDAAQTAHVTINYYDSAGNLTCSQSGETIPPLASNAYWAPGLVCLPEGWVGGAVVTADQPVVTIGRPHIGNQVTVYAGASSGARSVYLPMLFKNMWDSYDSAFYIQNTDPSGPAQVSVRFYDSDGNLSCTRSDSLPALATLGYWLPSVICMP